MGFAEANTMIIIVWMKKMLDPRVCEQVIELCEQRDNNNDWLQEWYEINDIIEYLYVMYIHVNMLSL